MLVTMTIQEAKARLSYLVAQTEDGQEVLIARAGRPVVRLVAVAEPPKRRLGIFPMELSEDAVARSLAPLDPDELALWTGASE
jgi:prevent-host-death family protein